MQSEMGAILYSSGAQYQSCVHGEASNVAYVPQHARTMICQQNFVPIEPNFELTQVVCGDHSVPAISRKHRLRWTSKLHDRFVRAVNDLGGAKNASPKAIRNKMGVDGLTLLHLKSHLQKYRLDVRRKKELRRRRALHGSGNMAEQPFNGGGSGGGSTGSFTSPMASGLHKAEDDHVLAAEVGAGAGTGQLQQTVVACGDNTGPGMAIEVPQVEHGVTPFFSPTPPVHVQGVSTYKDDTYWFPCAPNLSVQEYLDYRGRLTSAALIENLPAGYGGRGGGEASAAFGPRDFVQAYLNWKGNQPSSMDCALVETYPLGTTMFANYP